MDTNSEVGASSAEYGLLIALIAGIIVSSVLVFGSLTGALFTDSCNKMLADGVTVAVPAAQC